MTLVEAEVAGVEGAYSLTLPWPLRGSPKLFRAQTIFKSLEGLGKTPGEVKPQQGDFSLQSSRVQTLSNIWLQILLH